MPDPSPRFTNTSERPSGPRSCTTSSSTCSNTPAYTAPNVVNTYRRCPFRCSKSWRTSGLEHRAQARDRAQAPVVQLARGALALALQAAPAAAHQALQALDRGGGGGGTTPAEPLAERVDHAPVETQVAVDGGEPREGGGLRVLAVVGDGDGQLGGAEAGGGAGG